MKRFYLKATNVLLASLLFAACDDKSKNYPADYVGFERSAESHFYNKSNPEETMEIKVISVDKKKEDREIKLTLDSPATPGKGAICKLATDRLIIKAGKKEAKTTLILYPPKIIVGGFIHVTCTPQWKGGQVSKMSIELRPK